MLKRMPTPLVLLLALASGCTQDGSLTVIPGEIQVDTPVVDLHEIVVGRSGKATIELSHTGGSNIEITEITVFNLDGDYFAFAGSLPITIFQEGTTSFDVSYLSDQPGYHRGEVHIVSDAREEDVVANVLAHGVEGSVTVTPRLLDFGNVAKNASATLEMRLHSDRGEGMVASGISFSDARFASDDELPLDLPNDTDVDVVVRFTSTGNGPVAETLTIDFDGLADPVEVVLRANDCEQGAPETYDSDDDGFTSCAGDCDDGASSTHPGAEEVADGADQDCDEVIDEGTEAYDDDGDLFSEDDGDCNDAEPGVYPGAPEDEFNGIDDDCDGLIDLGAPDDDLDGYADYGGDCDETDPSIHPFAPEVADGIDQDCDTIIDEGTGAYDDDGDLVCEDEGDCDDGDPSIAPGEAETANWRDDDCDGDVDEGTANSDDDADGFTETGGDCDDANPDANPAMSEVSGNGKDDDCDGVAS